jgi:succinate dehydrogenase/fumarate reductase flavoprotein subunit
MEGIKEIRERLNHISLDDRAGNLNRNLPQFANQFGYMLEMALVITRGVSAERLSSEVPTISRHSLKEMMPTGSRPQLHSS